MLIQKLVPHTMVVLIALAVKKTSRGQEGFSTKLCFYPANGIQIDF